MSRILRLLGVAVVVGGLAGLAAWQHGWIPGPATVLDRLTDRILGAVSPAHASGTRAVISSKSPGSQRIRISIHTDPDPALPASAPVAEPAMPLFAADSAPDRGVVIPRTARAGTMGSLKAIRNVADSAPAPVYADAGPGAPGYGFAAPGSANDFSNSFSASVVQTPTWVAPHTIWTRSLTPTGVPVAMYRR